MFGLPDELFWGAVAGSVLPDVLRIIKQRFEGMPDWFKSWWFWLSVILTLALGVFAVWLTSEYVADPEESLTFLTAMGIGYAAPDILTTLVSKQGGTDTKLLAERGNPLIKWWAK